MKKFSEKISRFPTNKPEIKFTNFMLNQEPATLPTIQNESSLSIMTWNILASGYTSPSAYYYVKPEYLDENFRMNLISQDILHNNCDIICLQEVEKRNHTKKFQSAVFEEYEAFYDKRPALTCDGLSFLFKKKLFKLKEIELIKLNELSDNKLKLALKNFPFTNNIAQIAVLEPRDDILKTKLDFIIVVNIHLHWDPNKEQIKFFQIYEIIKKTNLVFNKLKYKSGNVKNKISVVLCGDFNSTPESNVVGLICDKVNEEGFPKEFCENYKEIQNEINKFKNFNLIDSHKDNSYLTNIKSDFQGKLDYIFYSNENIFHKIGVSFFDTNKFRKENALPNSFNGSDHLYLISKLYL